MKANSKIILNEFIKQLTINESLPEKEAITRLLFESEYGLTHTDLLAGKEVAFDVSKTDEWIKRINANEPVQYILGEAEFYGRKFKVNSSVLIPRPETELLIQEVLKQKNDISSVLDVGTGSGCIAITLKLEMSKAQVYTIDVSEKALSVAKENARALNADVNFVQGDFLKDVSISPVDVIVSNPPYVKESEKDSMSSNVLLHEPHLALFVSDNDPLLFYKAIAFKSKTLLNPHGKIFVEINEQYGKEVKELFERSNFHTVRIIKDLDGKDRIVSASLS